MLYNLFFLCYMVVSLLETGQIFTENFFARRVTFAQGVVLHVDTFALVKFFTGEKK